MAEDGGFPKELARTKPYAYSLFNLDVMSMVVQILSTPGENRWAFELVDGRSIGKGLALDHKDYIDLWKSLDPDPKMEEVIRNFPFRQPVLWLD